MVGAAKVKSNVRASPACRDKECAVPMVSARQIGQRSVIAVLCCNVARNVVVVLSVGEPRRKFESQGSVVVGVKP